MGQGNGTMGAYEGAAMKYAGKWSVSGAGGCCEGGDDKNELKRFDGSTFSLADVREYDKSLNSFTKKSLIDDLLDAMKGMGFSADGETDVDKVVDKLLQKIPNQKRNGKSFKKDAETQEKACALMAKSINKHYGQPLIDVRSEPAVVCQQVADIVASLKSSMHFEFLKTHEEIRKVIRNLHILKSSLNDGGG